ncbi:MAG TPA: sulfatase [Myxococcota bacterium]|jgi:arylsulfatase A-like enzyme
MLRKLLDSPWLYFAGAALLLALAVASQFRVVGPSRSEGSAQDIAGLRERKDLNVVFLLVDTLRADRLGAYGYPRPTSPEIDALARTGIVFRHVYSQSSWTKTSMASLWTGTYPARNGVLRYDHALPDEALLPAEILRNAGFRTAGIWRNGWVAPNFGFYQGFEFYLNPKPGRTRAQLQRSHPSPESLSGTDEDVADSAVAFLDSYGRERFFLYLHYMDLHQYVFDESAPDLGNAYSDAYDKSIRWIDRVIGALVSELGERGLLDRTVIVLASDHGEAFREHGFEGHARDLHREVAEVPFVIVLPFQLQPGIVVEERVANADIWPTLLDLLGLPPLPGADGKSLMPLVEHAAGIRSEVPAELASRPIFSQLDQLWGSPQKKPDPLVAVTEGNLRYFLPVQRPERATLFDSSTDPKELSDLRAQRAEDAERLRKLADGYLGNTESPWGKAPNSVDIDEMRLNQLRALGYVVK